MTRSTDVFDPDMTIEGCPQRAQVEAAVDSAELGAGWIMPAVH